MGEGGKGQVADAGVLGDADRVLAPGTAAVAQLQGGDVVLALVGDEGGMAVPVGVEDLELGPGMRALATHDQPCSLGPGREVKGVGQLGNPGALALGPIGFDRALPCRFGRGEDRLPNPRVDS